MSSALGEGLSQFVEGLAQKADGWKNTPLPGEWKPLAGPAGPSRKEAGGAAEAVFGTPVQRMVATEDGGKLTRLDVLFMERAAGAAADEAYLQSMRQAASKTSAGLQAKMGKPGQLVKPAAGAAPGTVVQEWAGAAATIRLTLEPGARLYVSMIPLQAAGTAKASPTAPATAAKGKPVLLKSRLEEKPNGDVMITGLPELQPMDDESNHALRVGECLAGYYGWTMDVRAVATANGWTANATLDNTFEVLEALSKAAKVEWTQQDISDLRKKDQPLDMMEARRWIDKGRPIVYRHMYSEIREAFLFEFAKQYEQNPQLELPSPKDPVEKSKWLHYDEKDDFYGSTAVIIGYNKKRGEFLLKYPGYAAGSQIIRMREEELNTSLLRVYYVPPS
ncbi:hypothetical protein [Prosthecobacter sp.]|uniref:hypothetical protein n=1 Tax=Prosthecobacter sp. TaxID=1965333 RepID=UPI003784473D